MSRLAQFQMKNGAREDTQLIAYDEERVLALPQGGQDAAASSKPQEDEEERTLREMYEQQQRELQEEVEAGCDRHIQMTGLDLMLLLNSGDCNCVCPLPETLLLCLFSSCSSNIVLNRMRVSQGQVSNVEVNVVHTHLGLLYPGCVHVYIYMYKSTCRYV